MVRNPGDQVIPKSMIRTFQSDFRILDEWTIEYKEDDEALVGDRQCTNGQCCHSVSDKLASIYPCPADVPIHKYVRHEMIHIALAALFGPDEPYGVRRRLEEEFVQDVCALTHV
jgi:hypothetical protein